MTADIARHDITGLVLAGGRGSRMGGVDKGLQVHAGMPLARHALLRLAPQVGPLTLSANRNLQAYAAFGVPVCPDALPGFAGPLAGFLAGLAHAVTPYLVTVPCDAPAFPADLVARLAAALVHEDADLAMAATPAPHGLAAQPVFCLLKTTLRSDLEHFVAGGDRKVELWAAQQRRVLVRFDDAAAFFNANTLADLQRLQAHV